MKLGPCRFEPGHAQMSAKATIEDFQAALEFAAWAASASPWWVGDLLNEAERRFGDKYSQAVPESISLSKANRLRSTAAKVKKAHRRPESTLSQGHYDTAARLPDVCQEEFLDRAEEEGLGTNEFRDLVSDFLGSQKSSAKLRSNPSQF